MSEGEKRAGWRAGFNTNHGTMTVPHTSLSPSHSPLMTVEPCDDLSNSEPPLEDEEGIRVGSGDARERNPYPNDPFRVTTARAGSLERFGGRASDGKPHFLPGAERVGQTPARRANSNNMPPIATQGVKKEEKTQGPRAGGNFAGNSAIFPANQTQHKGARRQKPQGGDTGGPASASASRLVATTPAAVQFHTQPRGDVPPPDEERRPHRPTILAQASQPWFQPQGRSSALTGAVAGGDGTISEGKFVALGLPGPQQARTQRGAARDRSRQGRRTRQGVICLKLYSNNNTRMRAGTLRPGRRDGDHPKLYRLRTNGPTGLRIRVPTRRHREGEMAST